MALTGLLLFLGLLLLLSAEQLAARFTSNCRLDPEYGPCRDEQVKIYFNWEYQKCLEFRYGGCRGNDNRFETIGACERACERRGPCNLPRIQGPCQGFQTRYFYDWTQKKCISFLYGGCGGNENRFRSAEICELVCRIRG